jgi:hypothetical protein
MCGSSTASSAWAACEFSLAIDVSEEGEPKVSGDAKLYPFVGLGCDRHFSRCDGAFHHTLTLVVARFAHALIGCLFGACLVLSLRSSSQESWHVPTWLVAVVLIVVLFVVWRFTR